MSYHLVAVENRQFSETLLVKVFWLLLVFSKMPSNKRASVCNLASMQEWILCLIIEVVIKFMHCSLKSEEKERKFLYVPRETVKISPLNYGLH